MGNNASFTIGSADMRMGDFQSALLVGGLALWEMEFTDDTIENVRFAVSESLVGLLGRDPGNFPDLPANFMEFSNRFLHPEDVDVVLNELVHCFRGKTPTYQLEHRLWNTQENRWRWINSFGSLREEEGKKRIVGAVQDIDDRIKAQRALNIARGKLSATIDAANLGAWEWDVKTNRARFSSGWAAILGYDQDEIGTDFSVWERFAVPTDIPAIYQALHAHLNGETPNYSVEFRMIHKNGEMIWVQDRGQIVDRDREGRPSTMMGVLMDVTRQKKTELTLLETKGHQELALGDQNIGSWEWNISDGTVIFNDKWLELLGYERGDVEETFAAWQNLIHPNERPIAAKSLNRVITGQDTIFANDLHFRQKDGMYVQLYDVGRVTEWSPEGKPSQAIGGLFNLEDKTRLEKNGLDSLTIITRQKRELERRMEERNRLLDTIKTRLDKIIAQHGIGVAESLSTLDPSFVPPSHKTGDDLTEFLAKALDFVTAQMRWYKMVIDSVPLSVLVVSTDLRWIYLNPTALADFEHANLADVVGKTCFGSSSSCGTPHCPHTMLMNGKTNFTSSNPQTGRVFQGKAAFFHDDSGERIGHIEVVQDVTELIAEEERTRIMLDATPLACSFWDENLDNIECNKAAIELFGFAGKEDHLEHFAEMSPPVQPDGVDSRELMARRIRTAFAEGRIRFEWMHRHVNGGLIPAEVTLVRVKHRDRYLVASYVRDLRELKAKERELDKERLLLRRIVNNSPISFLISVGGDVRFITPHARDLLGMDNGSPATRMFADPLEGEDTLREIAEGGSVSWRTVSVLGAGGRRFDMLLNAFQADYYGERGIMYWLMDVSELKENERQLKIARDLAEESANAKGIFLANMSHEIRTPMNAIIGLNHLLQLTPLTEQQHEYTQRSDVAAKALLRIINDILDFSKIDAGKLDMERIDFHLGDVLQNSVELLASRAYSKGLELLVDLPPDVPVRLVGDPSRLAQVVTNLLSNAVKFTENGEVRLSVRVDASEPDRILMRFDVVDTGIGLTPDQLERLFLPFSQADNSTTRKYGGTGLGLAISKRLVEMMGGAIYCESKHGRGSRFGFTAAFGLPLEKSPNSRVEVMRKSFKDMQVLLVDDNSSALEILKLNLEGMGFSVLTAESGEEAVHIVSAMGKRPRLDLVVVDYRMPGMDGMETVRRLGRIVEADALPPVIMATAYNSDQVSRAAQEAGILRVMTKPLSSSTLFNTIMDIFGKRLSERKKADKKQHYELVSHLRGVRVLLAEDNEVNQLVASRLLKNAGFEVTVVKNGVEAVKSAETEYFDVILMDIQMPEMDGLEATQIIRTKDGIRDIPIIAMTAHALTGDKDMSLRAGMDEHVTKPINIAEMFKAIARLVPKPGHRA